MASDSVGCLSFLCNPFCCFDRPVEVGLAIDLLDLKAVEFNPKTKKQTEHKFPPADDSDLTSSIIDILCYLQPRCAGDIKWVVFAGDLSINQQSELTAAVNTTGIFQIYYIDRFEGLMTYLLSQLYMSYSLCENVGVLIDRDTYCIGYLYKMVNGQLVKFREEKVGGTGIDHFLTCDDLKSLRDNLVESRFCDNWIIESSGNKLVLEKFFDYKIHETFLMVGLGYKSLSMVPYLQDNHFKGAVLKLRMLARDNSTIPLYVSKAQIDEKSLPEAVDCVPSCTIC